MRMPAVSAAQMLATATTVVGRRRMTTRSSAARLATAAARAGPRMYFSVIRVVHPPSASADSSALPDCPDLSVGPLTVASFRILDGDAEACARVGAEPLEVGAVDDARHVEGTVLPDEPERCDVREPVSVERGEVGGHVEREQHLDLARGETSGALDHRCSFARLAGPPSAHRQRGLGRRRAWPAPPTRLSGATDPLGRCRAWPAHRRRAWPGPPNSRRPELLVARRPVTGALDRDARCARPDVR
jgi:hypothetical protein